MIAACADERTMRSYSHSYRVCRRREAELKFEMSSMQRRLCLKLSCLAAAPHRLHTTRIVFAPPLHLPALLTFMLPRANLEADSGGDAFSSNNPSGHS